MQTWTPPWRLIGRLKIFFSLRLLLSWTRRHNSFRNPISYLKTTENGIGVNGMEPSAPQPLTRILYTTKNSEGVRGKSASVVGGHDQSISAATRRPLSRGFVERLRYVSRARCPIPVIWRETNGRATRSQKTTDWLTVALASERAPPPRGADTESGKNTEDSVVARVRATVAWWCVVFWPLAPRNGIRSLANVRDGRFGLGRLASRTLGGCGRVGLWLFVLCGRRLRRTAAALTRHTRAVTARMCHRQALHALVVEGGRCRGERSGGRANARMDTRGLLRSMLWMLRLYDRPTGNIWPRSSVQVKKAYKRMLLRPL